MTLKIYSADTIVSSPVYPVSGGTPSRVVHADKLYNWVLAMETYHNGNVGKLDEHAIAIATLKRQVDEFAVVMAESDTLATYVKTYYPAMYEEYITSRRAKARMDV